MSVVRYDCGNGGAQFCQGCYIMEQHPLGDYVSYEDYKFLLEQLALVTKLARIYIGRQHSPENAILNCAEALSDEDVSK